MNYFLAFGTVEPFEGCDFIRVIGFFNTLYKGPKDRWPDVNTRSNTKSPLWRNASIPYYCVPKVSSLLYFLAVFLKTEQSNKCCNSCCLVSVMGVAVSLWRSISTGSDLFLPTCCLIRSMMDFFSLSLLNWNKLIQSEAAVVVVLILYIPIAYQCYS